MTFTSRPSLRIAVLAAVAAGAVLLPAASAVADASAPVDRPAKVLSSASPKPERVKAPTDATKSTGPAVTPRGGVAAGDRPAPSVLPKDAKATTTVPRGGVAAGERPAGDDTAALIGSAAGIALLAGAGTVVLRRRPAVRHTA
ncbi:hypothetical protein EES43_26045 [Streptomyces sp. ADI96-02]|uniref:hypothetical protein n=1 Tax=unclassified Streptomyces TaxID=2593676 RepID=UPI000F554ECB|nr:hypothetical protein [Streptomyces sp. ADI96-02]RPK55588.1 hypothetical protein EES43_26045 [Streptomyces sp. ADI96-02]